MADLIERLEKENRTLKLAILSMPNWLDKKRPEVVRCKDCKWRNTPACFCKAPQDVVDDWFCSEGEPKDD